MANPKLAMIPTGYKAGKVYSVLPESGVGDFTFDRDSLATRVNENGLIETMAIDVPRLDYTDGGCPSLLLEPERTNLVTYSQDFSDSSWIKGNTSVVSGFTSPAGENNADKLVESTSNSVHYISSNSFSIVSGSYYSFSVFLKKGERNWLKIDSSSNSNWSCGANFDLENGVVGSIDSGSAKIENYGNDWYRCTITGLANTSTVVLADLVLGIGDDNINYQGDGTSGVYIYGAQLEQGEYATSYIPTNGSTVTRVAETCNGAGDASTFNDSEGVLMAEISALADDGTSRRISISDASINNRVSIEVDEISDRLKLFIDANSLQVDNIGLTNFTKICGKYKANDYSLWVNGFELATLTTSSNVPSGLDRLNFDGGGGNNDFYGNTKQIQYFDSALTDAELETLTSWQSFLEMANAQNYTII